MQHLIDGQEDLHSNMIQRMYWMNEKITQFEKNKSGEEREKKNKHQDLVGEK